MPDDDLITFGLSRDDYQRLLIMMGFAVSAAFAGGDRVLAYRFMDLVNRVNRDNPQFTPYPIPEEYRPDPGKFNSEEDKQPQ